MGLQLAPGPRNVELGYAEITSNHTTTTTNAHTVIEDAEIAIVVGSRPIVLEFWAPSIAHSAANANYYVFIREGTTDIAYCQYFNGAASELKPVLVKRRLQPSAGSHTYFATTYQTTVGTTTLQAAGSGPGHIQAVEV